MVDQGSTRFGAPVTFAAVEDTRKAGVPQKTKAQTSWSSRVWSSWAKERKKLPAADSLEANYDLREDFTSMSIESLQYWLPKFVLEVRRQDKEYYPPDSLYGICSGLQRCLKFCD